MKLYRRILWCGSNALSLGSDLKSVTITRDASYLEGSFGTFHAITFLQVLLYSLD